MRMMGRKKLGCRPVNAKQPDVVVIGAGAFGAWTALTLVERGARVTLIDAHGPGNHLGSSGGESRNIRSAYGDREIYTRWSIRSWALWQQRERELGLRFLFPSGGLRVLDDAAAAEQCAVFDRLTHPYELLSSDDVRKRWPQVAYDGPEPILYEPASGTLAARDALIALTRYFVALGGRYLQARIDLPNKAGGRLNGLDVDGERIVAETFIFACGPWLPRMFTQLLGPMIKTPRRELFFVGPVPGDPRFDWRNCPSLTDSLGWTSSDIGGGVKIAPIIRHVAMDPDNGSRMPTPALLDQVRAYLAARLPALADRPVVATYVSQLENSDNDHFIIDRHPNMSNVLIAGGGSGHAFKMGPALGEHVAGLAFGDAQDPALVALFSLDAHGPVAADQGG